MRRASPTSRPTSAMATMASKRPHPSMPSSSPPPRASVPPPLIAQLKPGGRMVIPVGSGFALQHLMIVEKDASGRVRTRQTLPVRFVPLTRGS